MLEIVDMASISTNTTALSRCYNLAKVNFIHRTAVDFLTKSRAGQNILNCSNITDMEIFTRLHASRMIGLIHRLVPLNPVQVLKEIRQIRNCLPADAGLEAERDALQMVDKVCERIVSQQIGLAAGDRWYSFPLRPRIRGAGGLDSCFLDLTVIYGV